MDERAQALLQEPNYAMVATLRRDGSVHTVVTWVDLEGEQVVLNSAVGRDWVANLRRDPRVTIAVIDRESPYRWIEVRGRVAHQDTSEEADAHIDRMAMKYLGQEEYPFRQADEKRVRLVVAPERVRVVFQG